MTVEIFEMTGKKVSPDDPVITAALHYSTFLRQAADQVMLAGRDIEKRISEGVAAAIQAEEKRLLERLEAQEKRFVERVNERIEKLMAKLRGGLNVTRSAEQLRKVPIANACIGLGTLVMLSAALGAHLFPEIGSTLKQRNEMALGRAVQQALPKLDKQTRVRLVELLESNLHSK